MRILSTISVEHIGSSFVFIATAKWIRIISYDMVILLCACVCVWAKDRKRARASERASVFYSKRVIESEPKGTVRVRVHDGKRK